MSPNLDRNLRKFFSLALGLQLMSTDLSAWPHLSAWTRCKGLQLVASGEEKEERKKEKKLSLCINQEWESWWRQHGLIGLQTWATNLWEEKNRCISTKNKNKNKNFLTLPNQTKPNQTSLAAFWRTTATVWCDRGWVPNEGLTWFVFVSVFHSSDVCCDESSEGRLDLPKVFAQAEAAPQM